MSISALAGVLLLERDEATERDGDSRFIGGVAERERRFRGGELDRVLDRPFPPWYRRGGLLSRVRECSRLTFLGELRSTDMDEREEDLPFRFLGSELLDPERDREYLEYFPPLLGGDLDLDLLEDALLSLLRDL